jgi:bifunctional DNA-binding transcriptional regulator/antitoxin component of YhaV-PrlF toxin-antitoxin module
MKVGERRRGTIPKKIGEQLSLGPDTELEFRVTNGSIFVKKAAKKLNLGKWRGHCGNSFAKLGYSSVDKFMKDIRGR